MAYELDPEVRVFSVDTGRLPAGDLRADRAAARALPGARPRPALTGRAAACSDGRAHGPNLFYRLGREPPALLQRPQGAAADAAPGRRSTPGSPACAATSGRRAPTSARSRSTTTTARSSSSTRSRSGPRKRSGTTCASATSRTTRSTTAATPRSAARPARARSRPGEAGRAGRWWWEPNAPKECGIHCAIETGGLRARAARDPRRGRARVSAVAVAGEAREVALAEAQAVLAMVHDEGAAGGSPDLVAASRATASSARRGGRARGAARARRSRPGASARSTAPAASRRRCALYRRLPARDRARPRAPREVTEALRRARRASELESVQLSAVGPGAFSLTLAAGGAELVRPPRPPAAPGSPSVGV